MPRREGLRPISEQMEKIRERLEKERERRKNKNKPVRVQPKLPGMMSGGMSIFKKRKKVEAGEPDKKKKNPIEEMKEKKDKRLKDLRKELGMARGGMKRKPRRSLIPDASPGPTRPPKPTLPIPKEKKPKRPGMKKGGMRKADGVMLIIESKADGGITGKTTFGELKKRFKPLKKGIRLKGKGSSFMKEYKKRVYNRAGGGSMNGGVRGTGIAVKGKNFKGVF